jgi:hypothetical protein
MVLSSAARLSVAVALCAGVNAFSMMGGRPVMPQRALSAVRAVPLMQVLGDYARPGCMRPACSH